MTIDEMVKTLESFDEDAMICARRPWSRSAQCVVVMPTAELTIPDAIRDAGYEYFLELAVAREALEVFGDTPPTHDEKVRLLLDYAETDAYPEWVYKPGRDE